MKGHIPCVPCVSLRKQYPGDWPDLQAMVERYGGWWEIPEDAWTEYRRRLKVTRYRLNLLHKPKED